MLYAYITYYDKYISTEYYAIIFSKSFMSYPGDFAVSGVAKNCSETGLVAKFILVYFCGWC